MAAASCRLTEDQFLCSICLDVFVDPVATPCGHNFCKTCITSHWDIKVHCQCPMCKEVFRTRPKLRVNTLISEMVAQFRQEAEREAEQEAEREAQQEASSSSSEPQVSKPGEVPCDVCTGSRLKALKSCLVCLTSYCETHLEPHLTETGLKRHQLIDPVENLENRICKKHKKPLELFCKDNQMCVCSLCAVIDHKTHDVVPLKEAHEGKKAELGKTEAGIQQMIQKRQMKIQEIKHSVELSKNDADREKTAGVKVFTSLRQLLKEHQKEITETVEEKQRTAEEQAEGLIAELEWEISELTKRGAEMEQLSSSEDDLDFLQSLVSLNAALPTKDWTGVSVAPPLYEGTVRTALSRFDEQLDETAEQMNEMIDELNEAELKKVQHYAVDVTLDPQTAHPRLIVSADGKQVKYSKIKKNVRDHPDRFSHLCNVLGRQSFSSGRFYYEVQVKEKTAWDLGVVRESINRKGKGPLSPRQGYWAIGLMNGEYTAHANRPVELYDEELEKIGVFVDYEGGVVSFYNADDADHIYSFSDCSFTEKLYPFFSPGGKNTTPLIITPVCLDE
ncbi:E3 ubiquitin-protein ligase TRIM39-like [Toxotes jaculatrix]|uniref:E3 ubiquitin-protein ligase TRIM39-like n=1 Tax=Toxotes jaculatrix TaxID=941984 RepID=UPI001B3AC8DF|nr:E3 ubiquitin-protein ligase TRIM39-like [Toxotes jaculatrix]XP_040908179.1 E3 ubiquitin-protein ligase TRIM39-like [Toxotes jaculatrix]